jgi:hypothetical protein
MKQNIEKQMLTEYQALRNEILKMYDKQDNILSVLIIIIAALITTEIYLKTPLANIIALLFLSVTVRRITFYIRGMVRAGAYIQVFLESELDGINWSTSIWKVWKKKGYPGNYFFNIYNLLLFSILGAISYSIINAPNAVERIKIIIPVILCMIVVYDAFRFYYSTRCNQYRNEMLEEFCKLKSERKKEKKIE